MIETHTHAGTRRMLALHFTKVGKLPVKWNKFYTDLFENRQTSDYADFVSEKYGLSNITDAISSFGSRITALLGW